MTIDRFRVGEYYGVVGTVVNRRAHSFLVEEPSHRSSQLSYRNVSPMLPDLSIFSAEARNLGFYVKFPVLNVGIIF